MISVFGDIMGARKKEALEQFNRDNIVTAARELFEQKGIEKTTMDDIAAHADYSKSTIYVYFRSKEDIYNAIVSDCVEILAGELGASIREDSDFKTGFYKLCDSLVRFESRYPKYYTSLMGENKITNSKKSGDNIRISYDKLNAVLIKLLAIGQNSNLISKNINPEAEALYIWSALGGIIQVAERKKDYIKKNIKMTKKEYLKYSFDNFYEALVGR